MFRHYIFISLAIGELLRRNGWEGRFIGGSGEKVARAEQLLRLVFGHASLHFVDIRCRNSRTRPISRFGKIPGKWTPPKSQKVVTFHTVLAFQEVSSAALVIHSLFLGHDSLN